MFKKLKNRRKNKRAKMYVRATEESRYIKKYNIGDSVITNNSKCLPKRFQNVQGIIMTLAKDDFGSWQYIILLGNGMELQCDDTHLF